jgi:prevent-host-death family protein
MTEPTSITTTEARTDLARYLREASEGRIVHITNHGYRVAALVSPADAEKIEASKR